MTSIPHTSIAACLQCRRAYGQHSFIYQHHFSTKIIFSHFKSGKPFTCVQMECRFCCACLWMGYGLHSWLPSLLLFIHWIQALRDRLQHDLTPVCWCLPISLFLYIDSIYNLINIISFATCTIVIYGKSYAAHGPYWCYPLTGYERCAYMAWQRIHRNPAATVGYGPKQMRNWTKLKHTWYCVRSLLFVSQTEWEIINFHWKLKNFTMRLIHAIAA